MSNMFPVPQLTPKFNVKVSSMLKEIEESNSSLEVTYVISNHAYHLPKILKKKIYEEIAMEITDKWLTSNKNPYTLYFGVNQTNEKEEKVNFLKSLIKENLSITLESLTRNTLNEICESTESTPTELTLTKLSELKRHIKANKMVYPEGSYQKLRKEVYKKILKEHIKKLESETPKEAQNTTNLFCTLIKILPMTHDFFVNNNNDLYEFAAKKIIKCGLNEWRENSFDFFNFILFKEDDNAKETKLKKSIEEKLQHELELFFIDAITEIENSEIGDPANFLDLHYRERIIDEIYKFGASLIEWVFESNAKCKEEILPKFIEYINKKIKDINSFYGLMETGWPTICFGKKQADLFGESSYEGPLSFKQPFAINLKELFSLPEETLNL